MTNTQCFGFDRFLSVHKIFISGFSVFDNGTDDSNTKTNTQISQCAISQLKMNFKLGSAEILQQNVVPCLGPS